MAINRRQLKRRKKMDAPIPSDDDFFPNARGEESQETDIFASLSAFASEPDLDFYSHRWDPVSPADSPQSPLRRPSTLQKSLLVCIALIAGILASILFTRLQSTQTAPPTPLRVQPQQRTSAEIPLSTPPNRAQEGTHLDTAELNLPRPEPMSLQIAEKFYLAGDYENALLTYAKLHRRLSTAEKNQPLREFLPVSYTHLTLPTN